MQMYPKCPPSVWLGITSFGQSGTGFVYQRAGQGTHGLLSLLRSDGTNQVTKANSTFEKQFRGSNKPLNVRSDGDALCLWYLHSPYQSTSRASEAL